MKDNSSLSIDNIAELPVFKTGDGLTPSVTLVKTHNHVFRVQARRTTYYLKTHTKDWYPEDPDLVGHLPQREAFAWQLMRDSGLSTPTVVAIDATCQNAIGRPFLVTEKLKGEPLTNLIDRASDTDSYRIIRSVGEYLRIMHSMAFKRAGILTPQGPRIDGDWHHRIWTYHGFKTWALAEQKAARTELLPKTYQAVLDYLDKWQLSLKEVYENPSFVHGDCHAHQFFLHCQENRWNVSGVVDLEVASAGDSGEDFMKLCAEMARRFAAESEWWKPLFEGYGEEPDFALMKLRYLASGQIELSPFAYQQIHGLRERVVQHVLEATSWCGLFDLSQVRAEHFERIQANGLSHAANRAT